MSSGRSFESYVWIRRDVLQEIVKNHGHLPKGWKPSRKRGRTNDSWQWVKAKLISSTTASASEGGSSPFGQVKLRRVYGSPGKQSPGKNVTSVNRKVTVLVDDIEASSLNHQTFTFETGDDSLVQSANTWWQTGLESPYDLTTLSHLHEPEVVYCLRKRYEKDLIYTYTGRILLALNPFTKVPHLDGPQVMQRYQDSSLHEEQPPPHVYATAQDAYSTMIREGGNQSILVSGESGSGKTVTTKIILGYLTSLSEQRIREQRSHGGIESQVIHSNPILESFGNARTVRNDNSSRFGKFIDVRFQSSGRLQSASIETYLLEKVRLIAPAHGERNYHIFYELLTGLPQRERKDLYLGNHTPQDFCMTAASGTFDRRDGVDDRNTYRALRKALTAIGFTLEDIKQVFSVCCALLHCSNLQFIDTASGACKVDDSTISFRHALELLGVSSEPFNKALCFSTIQARGEVLHKNLSPEQATKALEALMKAVYVALFHRIVKKINRSISVRDMGGVEAGGSLSIGVLDIFGFESFDSNSFEQLCINFCNEALQQQFNQYVFKLEQEEYEREGIEWSFISFPDNQDVLDLMEKKHTGIISILDEQSFLASCTDQSFSRALYEKCIDHPRFSATSSQKILGRFSIEHYAGMVEYNTNTFLEKNKDDLSKETTELLKSSKSEIIASLGEFLAKSRGIDSNGSNRGGILRRSPSSLVKESVGSQFSGQLRELRVKIERTEPHYIRCLKPNELLIPGRFVPAVIADQLRCAGVLEAIRVSRVGFPHRYRHIHFLKRYEILARKDLLKQRRYKDDRERCERLARAVAVLIRTTADYHKSPTSQQGSMNEVGNALGVQVGQTKVFMRLTEFERFENFRNKMILQSATQLQSLGRRFLTRRRFLAARRSVLILQSFARRLCAIRDFGILICHKCATVIQTTWRRFLAQRYFMAALFIAYHCQAAYRGMTEREIVGLMIVDLKATCIQSVWRRYRAMQYLRLQIFAATLVQGLFRMTRAKRVLYALRKEAKDVKALAKQRDEAKEEAQRLRMQVQEMEESSSPTKAQESPEVRALQDEIFQLKLKLARMSTAPLSPRLPHKGSGGNGRSMFSHIHSVGGKLSSPDFPVVDDGRSLLDVEESDSFPDQIPREVFSERVGAEVSNEYPMNLSFRGQVSHFHHAIYSRDAPRVLRLLSNSDFSTTLVNECNPVGKSPLHMAVAANSANLVTLLLEHGAAANWQDFDGNTVLHICENSEIVGLLLERGRANPNIPNHQGLSALHMAVGRLDVGSVQHILRYDADVNVADHTHWVTPLHIVAQKMETGKISRSEHVSRAGAGGATTTTGTMTNTTAVYADRARARIASLLCGAPNADLNFADKDGNTPLHNVVIMDLDDACDLLRIFLDSGSNPNILNARGQSPLHLLCHNNGLRQIGVMQEMLHNILYHGANPNLCSQTGCTALHLTLYHRDVDSAVQLMNRGAELHLVWNKPKRWSAFWDDMGTTHVLALDMVSEENELFRILAAISKPQKWAPNRPWCMSCRTMLGSFGRALHCRHCGRLVCGACTPRTLDPAYFPISFEIYERSWVCITCERILVSRKKGDEDEITQPNTSLMGEDESNTMSQCSF